MNRDLIIVRGISGAGKTTFAELISNVVFSADNYFEKNGKYEFNADLLGAAHLDCQAKTRNAMEASVTKICVANTFTTEREIKPYTEMARKYGYRVFSVIVENRANTTNVHNVPTGTLESQRKRFSIKL